MVIKQPNSAEGGCTRGELSIPVLKYIWYLAYNRELSGRVKTNNNQVHLPVLVQVPVQQLLSY